MQITTKFDIDDTAYFMEGNRVQTGVVVEMSLSISAGQFGGSQIRTLLIFQGERVSLLESTCFRSKEELLASL